MRLLIVTQNIYHSQETQHTTWIATYISILIDLIIINNAFSLNDKYYLQTNGTAMGTKMAPEFAIL